MESKILWEKTLLTIKSFTGFPFLLELLKLLKNKKKIANTKKTKKIRVQETAQECKRVKHKWKHMLNIHKNKQKKINAKQSLEEIFNNFYYKILYSYPFIGDYYINTML